MFLTNTTTKAVFEGLEQNSTLANFIWTLVGILISSLFWGFRFRRDTRAAATFGFYNNFRRILTELQRLIKEIKEKNNGANPYCLLYIQDTLDRESDKLKVPFGSVNNCIDTFKESAEAIQKILTEATNNVYPSWCRKKNWYQKQQVLYDFSQMIVNAKKRNSKTDLSEEHNKKWKELQDAVEYLAKKIDKAIY